MNAATRDHWIVNATFVVLLVIAGTVVPSCNRGGDGEHHDHDHEGSQPAAAKAPSGTLEDGVRVVKIMASQFEFAPDNVVVIQGEKVRLEVTSADVTHGIVIDKMGIDRKLEPKKTEVIEFTAGTPGNYHFHCSVYCGDGHSRMHGEVIVLQAGSASQPG